MPHGYWDRFIKAVKGVSYYSIEHAFACWINRFDAGAEDTKITFEAAQAIASKAMDKSDLFNTRFVIRQLLFTVNLFKMFNPAL